MKFLGPELSGLGRNSLTTGGSETKLVSNDSEDPVSYNFYGDLNALSAMKNKLFQKTHFDVNFVVFSCIKLKSEQI